jgi:hypothetical protein
LSSWVIIKCDYGQLGNRLHTHVNALAWCKKNKFNLLNLSFSDYSFLFHSSNNLNGEMYYTEKNFLTFVFSFRFFRSFLNKFLLSNKWLSRFSFFFHKNDNLVLNKSHHDDLDILLKSAKKINIIHEWDLNCPYALIQNAKWIRKIMTPSYHYVEKAEEQINSFKKKFDYIVGVHARRGDYKNYLKGKHYHSWEDYKKWIIQMISVFKNEGYCNLGFVLCSDEKPKKQIFKDLPIHFSDEDNMMIDMHILSLCDYNVGPPSSFGTWISWYGKIPRMIIERNYIISSLEQFSICERC